MLPQILQDFNVFVDGIGYAGRLSEFVSPKITKKVVEIFNSGMSAPVEQPVGYEKLAGEMTFSEITPALAKLIAKNGANDVPLRLVGDYVDPNDAGKKIQTEVVLTGFLKEIDTGTFKRGDQTAAKYSWSGAYYKLTQADTVLIEINALEPFGA